MAIHLTTVEDSINTTVKKSIEEAIDGAKVEVEGQGGHFRISVVSEVFEGKNMLQSQRLVLKSIAHLMAGDNAPVHAVDTLTTKTP